MSRENWADAVRRLWAAFSERDWPAFSTTFDPDVEYSPVEEDVVYRGPEAVTEYAQRWLEVWETFSGEPEKIEEIERTPEQDRAFVTVHFLGKGKGSGVEIDDRLFWVAVLREGRLYRINEYATREEALEAVGLRE
jgi:ketosteroid isomerase-like protein